MEYKIDCKCGGHVVVGEAAADAVRACPRCGGPIQVPSWQELRQLVGLPRHNISPEVMVEHMLMAGELPGTEMCASCSVREGLPVMVHTECEVALATKESNSWLIDWLSDIILPFEIWWKRTPAPETVQGRDKIYLLPLPLCDSCRPSVRGTQMVKACMARIPEYRRLLEKFPDAAVRLPD